MNDETVSLRVQWQQFGSVPSSSRYISQVSINRSLSKRVGLYSKSRS